MRREEETNTTQMELCLPSAPAYENRLVNPFLEEGFTVSADKQGLIGGLQPHMRKKLGVRANELV